MKLSKSFLIQRAACELASVALLGCAAYAFVLAFGPWALGAWLLAAYTNGLLKQHLARVEGRRLAVELGLLPPLP